MKKHLANILTVSRMLVSPVGMVFAWQGIWWVATVIFLAAALSDAADGMIARPPGM